MRYSHHKHHLHPMNLFMWVVSLTSPLATIPQIIKIYTTHDALGLSPLTWLLYILFPCIWLVYGYLHKDRFIIANNLLWITFSLIVFAGIIKYA